MQKQITILGRGYTLRADDGDELEAAAADVDQRMRQLMSRSPNVDPYTVAMLTALNLASEMRSVKRGFRDRLTAMERNAATVETVLAAAVAEEEE